MCVYNVILSGRTRLHGFPTYYTLFVPTDIALLRPMSMFTTMCLKNVPPLACYNFNTDEWILIFLVEMLPIK